MEELLQAISLQLFHGSSMTFSRDIGWVVPQSKHRRNTQAQPSQPFHGSSMEFSQGEKECFNPLASGLQAMSKSQESTLLSATRLSEARDYFTATTLAQYKAAAGCFLPLRQ